MTIWVTPCVLDSSSRPTGGDEKSLFLAGCAAAYSRSSMPVSAAVADGAANAAAGADGPDGAAGAGGAGGDPRGAEAAPGDAGEAAADPPEAAGNAPEASGAVATAGSVSGECASVVDRSGPGGGGQVGPEQASWVRVSISSAIGVQFDMQL